MLTFKIGGQAGQGIKSAGLLFAKFAVRSGYHIYDHTEYPSLIRGGHNVMQVNVAQDEVTSPRSKTDILIALNQDTINKHISELDAGADVIYNIEGNFDVSKINSGINVIGMPLAKIATDAGGKELLSNTVALGAVIGLWGGDISILKTLLAEEFGDKGEQVVAMNVKAAEDGYNFVLTNFKDKVKTLLPPMGSLVSNIILNGNDAVALGAIAAGLQFAAIYPMSPASGILQTLADNQEEFGYIYKQPEDEISGINMAIGASFAGARSLVSTSGGGFCLMTEGYGLAGITETPVVMIDGMRGGPATGLPTWNSQGDLLFLLHAHQDEFPRIVLAAGDPKETFDITMQAFNLADKYQTPVVILIDKDICENDQSFEPFNISTYKIDRGKFTTQKVEDYKRYKLSEDGISQRSIPGVGNFFVSNSDEHTETGFSSEEIEDRNNQMNKRMTKLKTCEVQDMKDPTIYGPQDADVTLVSWGSNKGAILEYLKTAKNVNYMHVTWMNPFPTKFVTDFLKTAKNVIDIEENYSGQLAQLIRYKTGIDMPNKLLKFDGRPIYPEEIDAKVKEVLG